MSDSKKPKTFRYDAFISYSRKDVDFAEKLEKALENYKPPKDLYVPHRNLNVFRDVTDMTGVEYFHAIEEHLSNSAKLILICSPNARHSKSVNDEIRRFVKLHGAENIIPILLAGVPNNETYPGQEAQKAFPEALCEVMKMPLATSYRNFNPKKDKIDKGKFEVAWHNILANLYNSGRDVVEQREKKRQQRLRKRRTALLIIVPNLALILIFISIGIYEGVKSRRMLNVEAYHNAEIAEEFTQREYQAFSDFSDYLRQEEALIRRCYQNVKTHLEAGYNRYNPSSPASAMEENFSFELLPKSDDLKGGILLIHGLGGSPHHMRALGKIFQDQGYYVIGLRQPGHSTVPAALLNAQWEDWYTAVEFGVRMVQAKLGENQAFYLGGFSTGGTLTLRYTLKALQSEDMRQPDKLFLFSPVFGFYDPLELADLVNIISWIPSFDKYKWETIEPENDPCNYKSFPKNASDQAYELTKATKELVQALKDNGKIRDLPPVYTFQSVADATVIINDLVNFYRDIGPNEGELIFFDVNHAIGAPPYIIDIRHTNYPLAEIKSKFTFVTNSIESDSAVTAYTWDVNSIRYDFGSAASKKVVGTWPDQLYALAHISIPISPEDPYYGIQSFISNLNLRGEPRILFFNVEDLTRLKYNPFFSYVENVLLVAISNP